MKHDWFNGRHRDEVLRETVAITVASLEKQYGSSNLNNWKTRIFYRYYDLAAKGKDPEKPDIAYDHLDATRTAGALGLLPSSVPANMSEYWNMLIELKPGEAVLYDSTPSGGQSLFISTDGKGNPHIGDQVSLHENFEFKAVALDHDRVVREAASSQRLSYRGGS
jgi:penicillin G amidase